MKVYQTNEIKNIALLGSSGSGKTTLVEAMLFESGVIKRRGSVAAKNTVSDYFPVEQEYGYSVFSTVLHVDTRQWLLIRGTLPPGILNVHWPYSLFTVILPELI